MPRPSRPQHAEAVGVVEQEPGVVALGEGDQFRHRRDVAIHAEHRVSDDEPAARSRSGQQPLQRREVEVRIALEGGPRQQRGVVQRGVVQPVGEHRVLAPDQRRHGADVGEVAGGKQQRARQADERREPLLQLVVRRRVAQYQVGCAGADAVARRALARGLDQPRMGGEPEIVVAAECDIVTAVHRDARALRRPQHAARTPEAALLDLRKFDCERLLE